MIAKIYIGTDRVDLFKDENIEVVSSVLDINDITKNTTTYSKTFTVPASDSNNKLFKHWYDANIDNSFDSRIKVDGRIDLDDVPFRIGKWRLSKVSVKKGKPSSYTINFFGNLTDVKKKAKNKELSDLDLSAYDHDYTSANVLTGLTTSLSSGDVVYIPMAKKQYYFNSASDNTQQETLANIAYQGGTGTGIIWNDLRPSLRLINIIEAIEAAPPVDPATKGGLGVTFSRDFFGTSEFENLFMWMNPDKDKNAGGDSQVVDFDGGDTTYMNTTTDIGTYDKVAEDEFFILTLNVTPSAGYEDIEYSIAMYKNGTQATVTSGTGNVSNTSSTINDAVGSISVYYEVTSEQEFAYTASLSQTFFDPFPTTVITTASANTIDSVFTFHEEVPKLKIIDFLKGLMQMFKLVIIPQDDGTLYVNTLDAYYAEGGLYDVSNYVDYESVEVERGNILNEITLKFQEPTTLLNTTFEQNTGAFYGDEEAFLEDDNGEPLDGDTLEVELPFEQILYERLTDQETGIKTNIQYGGIFDESISPVTPKAHIHYVSNNIVGINVIGFINDLGTQEAISTSINVPSHTDVISSANYSTVFGSEFSTWNGVAIEKTLYANHYQTYVESIFNVKKRTFKYSAILPLRIVTKLELNDILKIKNDYYRIDKFTTNLTTGETKLELVNSLDNTFNVFGVSRTYITTDYTAKTETVTVTNLSGAVVALVDTGFGTAWITPTTSGNILSLAVSLNSLTTYVYRSAQVTVTQGTQVSTITIIQTEKEYVPSMDFSDYRNSNYASLITLRH